MGADADALIAASHVLAVHFQTLAAANDFGRQLGSRIFRIPRPGPGSP